MHGMDFHHRGAIAEEHLGLSQAKTGEPFELHSQIPQVTPIPFTRGRPSVSGGGGSVDAIRRAGRHGLDFLAQSGDESLGAAYVVEAEFRGHAPDCACCHPTT